MREILVNIHPLACKADEFVFNYTEKLTYKTTLNFVFTNIEKSTWKLLCQTK